MKRDTMHVNTKGKRRRNRNFNESWNTDLPGASKNGSNIESNVDTQGFSGFVRTRSSYRQACIENMGMCMSPEQNSSVASHGNDGDATIHNNIAASNTMDFSEDRATCDGYKENMCFTGGDEVLSSHLEGRKRGKSGCRMLQDITNVAVNLQSKFDLAATSEGRVCRRSSYRLARMQNQGSITNTSGSIDAVMLGSGETQPNQLSAYSGKQELYKQIRFEFNKETYSDDDSSLAGVEEPEGCDVDEDAVFGTQPVSTVNPYASELDYDHEGSPSYKCLFCNARLWEGEKVTNETLLGQPLFSICCMKGKIQLPKLSSPPEPLWSMYFDKKNESYKNFRENIRSYNNMFSFTSMGGKIDHGLNAGHGPYTFVLSGTNYHSIGNLVPPVGQPTVFSQMYIYDTENEVSNRISAVSKHLGDTTIDPCVVEQIMKMLDECNPFVKQYRMASAIIKEGRSRELKLRLIGGRDSDGRNYNLPAASEVAALIEGDIDMNFCQRDVLVHEHSGAVQHIDELHASYLPLQYPLLFPLGEDGYRDDVYHREETLARTKKKKRVTMREFFAFRLMFRDDEESTILHSERLLQQFIVDAYTMLESQRILWVKTHQKELRIDLYQGLSDALTSGECDAQSLGKRLILPSSFTGGARYMLQNYQNAMALCGTYGYPELFITFTCNSSWPEVKSYCAEANVSTANRADLLARVFRLKLRKFMKTIKDRKMFGEVVADVYTIEFQKRGLPHAHILLWLHPRDKLKEPDDIDRIISAEIPDKVKFPKLYALVKRFMVHGPCGSLNRDAFCMREKRCSKYFPKPYCEKTTIDHDGFPTYRRRDDGRRIEVRHIDLGNGFVVPYNADLLYKFNAHINVEKCNQSTAIKYLFKYISKGHDRVVASIYDNARSHDSTQMLDEIQRYYNFRYIAPCEAAWRIFSFDIHRRHPHVERLCFHLPNQQSIIYLSTVDVGDLLDKVRIAESMFLSWMKTNEVDPDARNLLYYEFPKHYVYDRSGRCWTPRKQGKAIGRITYVPPSSGELYFLRILLTKVKGPRSFEEIRTVDGVIYPTFREACFARGLIDDDREYVQAIKEAAVWATGAALRRMFVSMLLCSSLSRPDFVWQETVSLLSEDMLYVPRNETVRTGFKVSQSDKEKAALQDIQAMLEKNGRTLNDFPNMPIPMENQFVDVSNQLIIQELAYDREQLKVQSEKMVLDLTSEQRIVFDAVLSAVGGGIKNFFFVYGYGGTGKTFLWNALAATLRAKGDIVLTVASSGIAATLLPSGRTAHSRFAIPIQVTEDSVCSISQGSPLANLIICTKLIIWDEAPMVHRFCVESFDRSLRDILHSSRPFGGKCVVMGGDFRQILPVIPKGSRAAVVDACISSSRLWRYCTVFTLTRNMRLGLNSDARSQVALRDFAQWLLDVGDGKLGLPHDGEAEIDIPPQLLVSGHGDPIDAIVQETYPDLLGNMMNNQYFNDRAILAPTIEAVDRVNEFMCSKLFGEAVEYLSCDSICQSCQDNDSFESLHTTEYLNTINCSGLPSHSMLLKVGCPIMLLRNIDQANGLCNGTRLVITQLGNTVIEAISLNGSHPNQRVLIHRMDMNPSNSSMPFKMKRRQFPISLSFAMTINKSQGQSLRYVGLYLSKPVFTHGQLYVALSRVRSMDGLKIVLGDGHQINGRRTMNVVYREIFGNIIDANASIGAPFVV